jgi:hypothetical protein
MTSPNRLNVRSSSVAGPLSTRAADAYLATLRYAEHVSTRRTCGRILARVAAEFGSGASLGETSAERFARWFR